MFQCPAVRRVLAFLSLTAAVLVPTDGFIRADEAREPSPYAQSNQLEVQAFHGCHGKAGSKQFSLRKGWRISRLVVFHGDHRNHDIILRIEVYGKTQKAEEGKEPLAVFGGDLPRGFAPVVFTLGDTEVLREIDATFGRWCDNLTFSTNVKQSPVIGNTFGGVRDANHQYAEMRAPANGKITGLAVEFGDANAITGMGILTAD